MEMNNKTFEIVFNELKEKVVENHISNISFISKTGILFTLSFYRKEKIFISIDNMSPFISLVEINENITNSAFYLSEILRREIKDSFIKDIEKIDNDRIIIFELIKNVSLVLREKRYLVLELIPKRPRLIILDEEKKIIFSSSYDNIINNDRVILNKIYNAPIKNIEENKEIIIDKDYKNKISIYLKNEILKGIKQRHEPLFSFIYKRIKTINKKIVKLEEEQNDGIKEKEYKEIGDALLVLDSSDLLNFINGNNIIYDDTLSKYQNAEKYYKKYKKAKSKIEATKEQIEKANDELSELKRHQEQLLNMNEIDLLYLEEKYLGKTLTKNKRAVIESKLPYYVIFKNVKIGFGKNDAQNNELTFELSNRNYYYFHIKDYHGPHVVVFSDSLNQDLIDIASDIAIYLANKKEGTVLCTKIKDVKKTNKLGLVELKNETLYRVDNVKESTIKLLETATRFSR